MGQRRAPRRTRGHTETAMTAKRREQPERQRTAPRNAKCRLGPRQRTGRMGRHAAEKAGGRKAAAKTGTCPDPDGTPHERRRPASSALALAALARDGPPAARGSRPKYATRRTSPPRPTANVWSRGPNRPSPGTSGAASRMRPGPSSRSSKRPRASPAVQELAGLAAYRSGRWREASDTSDFAPDRLHDAPARADGLPARAAQAEEGRGAVDRAPAELAGSRRAGGGPHRGGVVAGRERATSTAPSPCWRRRARPRCCAIPPNGTCASGTCSPTSTSGRATSAGARVLRAGAPGGSRRPMT